jgi:hypothetical protein
VGGVITVFIFSGVAAVVGLSAGILGGNIGMPSLSMMTGGASGGGAIVYGGIFGFGILFALVGAVFMSMAILGLNRLYLHLTRDLDLAGAQAALGERMDAAKQRALAMQEEARRRAEEMRQRVQAAKPAGSPAAVVAPQPKAAAEPTCPKCSGPITADDVFCGSCGHKLH